MRRVENRKWKVESFARLPAVRCRGGACPSRRRAAEMNRLSLKWQTPPICHCEGALRPWQSREGTADLYRPPGKRTRLVGAGLSPPGAARTTRASCRYNGERPPICHCEAPTGPWQSREGSYVFAGAFLLSNCVLQDCHVASLLAMTHQVVQRCTSALLPLNDSVQGGQ